MAKKVVSFALHKKKPIKHSSKRRKLRTVFKKIFSYMKSDTYMFAPLVYPQSYLPSSSPVSFREVSCEPIKKNEKKLAEDVGDYLKCDCYMYAPLVMDSASGTATPPIGDGCRGNAESGSVYDKMESRMEETARKDGNNLNRFREIEHDDDDDDDDDNGDNPMRRIAVKHIRFHRETVKRVLRQNCRPSSVPEKMFVRERAP